MKINKLAELNEILTELEDEGFFREAEVLHQEFIKISQVTLDQPKPNFKDMLTEYAPSFLKLCRTYPTKVKAFGVPTYTADPTSYVFLIFQFPCKWTLNFPHLLP